VLFQHTHSFNKKTGKLFCTTLCMLHVVSQNQWEDPCFGNSNTTQFHEWGYWILSPKNIPEFIYGSCYVHFRLVPTSFRWI